jgi:predicted N-acetyltransferase YhbS
MYPGRRTEFAKIRIRYGCKPQPACGQVNVFVKKSPSILDRILIAWCYSSIQSLLGRVWSSGVLSGRVGREEQDFSGTPERLDTLALGIHQALLRHAGGNDICVIGPFSGTDEALLGRVLDFRSIRYRTKRQYLHAAEQLDIERRLRLDERSQHFVAQCGDRIVGSVRLTPPPFEFSALAPSLVAEAEAFATYVELSRLVVDPVAGRQKVTASLLVAACHWARAANYPGVVALCRRASRVIFERYGLSATSRSPHFIPWRGSEPYALMAGAWPELILKTLQLSDRLLAANPTDQEQGPSE